MNITLLGHGKMGRYIEKLALGQGDTIHLIVDEANRADVTPADLRGSDVAIDFSRPDAAVANIELALAAGVPVVVGTTGWLHELPAVRERVKQLDGALFWASNFSVGVNVFFAVAQRMAALLGTDTNYAPAVEEIHHLQKLDAPSGTAITLAEKVGEHLQDYASWTLDDVDSPVPQSRIAPAAAPHSDSLRPVPITAVRRPEIPGTHTFTLASAIDTLELKHTAHGREGFASGALVAARWLRGKRGVFTMDNLLAEPT